MLSLLQIPLEIRREIYRHCLVAHGPINPHPAAFGPPKYAADEANKPSVQLLRINKQVEIEAADVLYSENQWIVPVFHLPRNAAMIPDKYCARWRHVVVYIDYRNIDRAIWAKTVARNHEVLSTLQSDDRIALIHTLLQRYVRYELTVQCIAVAWDIDRLHTLVLDLEYTYCAIGCCRFEVMRDYVFLDLLPTRIRHSGKAKELQKVMVKGLKTQEERDLACGRWGLMEV